MDAVEREIYHYLRSRRPKAVDPRDINRHVGRRKFRSNPEWAKPALLRMQERGILETDAEGAYRLKPIPRQETDGKRWASPAMPGAEVVCAGSGSAV